MGGRPKKYIKKRVFLLEMEQSDFDLIEEEARRQGKPIREIILFPVFDEIKKRKEKVNEQSL